MKKLLSIIIIVLALGWVGIEYVAEKTVATTNELIDDDIHTDWVKAAKKCETIDTIAIADTTNTVDGDGIR